MTIQSFHLIESDFKDVRKVDEGSFEVFQQFHQYDRLKYPVFFHSVTEMIGMGGFYWVKIRNCLVVFRVSKMYGNYSCIVYFSPISINNDVDMERAVFAALLMAGFSVRLTGHEVERLRVNLKVVKGHKDAFYNEFIYSIKDTLEMQGHKYAGIRNMVKRFDKEGGYVDDGYDDNVLNFVRSWAKMKKINYNRIIDFLNTTDQDNLFFTTLYLNGFISGFTVVEKVGRFYHAIVIISSRDVSFDLVPALHYYMVSGLSDKDTLLTSGAGCVGGLDVQKRRMRPVFEETVYRIPAIGSVRGSYDLVKDFLK